MSVREYEERRDILIAYLKMKAREEDWHAVADAAMDLREMEAEECGRRDGVPARSGEMR